jgi:hypothetical protein
VFGLGGSGNRHSGRRRGKRACPRGYSGSVVDGVWAARGASCCESQPVISVMGIVTNLCMESCAFHDAATLRAVCSRGEHICVTEPGDDVKRALREDSASAAAVSLPIVRKHDHGRMLAAPPDLGGSGTSVASGVRIWHAGRVVSRRPPAAAHAAAVSVSRCSAIRPVLPSFCPR